MMPFITSQFLTRTRTDRPPVVQKAYPNLAFIGQYCEIPDDVVFTVEYSVRAAQIATYSLLHLAKEPNPIYHAPHPLHTIFEVVKTAFSEGVR